MTDLHPVGVLANSQEQLEAVGPQFVKEGLFKAQEKSWEVFEELKKALKVGMTEKEAQELAYSIFQKRGVTKHWHRPYIRFGPGTLLTFYDILQKDYRLQENDAVYFDLGPVWKDDTTSLEYEGDIGDTFVFGENPEAEKCISAIHTLFQEALAQWKEKRLSGDEIYQFFKKRTGELGVLLNEDVAGHRVSDYPHVKYAKERLSNVQFFPSDGLWILELHIKHPTLPLGAFYEDLLS